MKTIVQGEAALAYEAVDELVQALTPCGAPRRVERGERLFSLGEAARGVYLIAKGTARASLPGAKGRELVCRRAGPGAVLGLPSALCATHYQFDVEALETVDALFVETGPMNEILRQRPELCMQLMKLMCDELSALGETRDHMRSCGKESCSLHGSCRLVESRADTPPGE